MEIVINDKPANITLDTEKTLGDVLSGIESWVAAEGNRIRKISVNGETVDENTLTKIFEKDIRDIKKLALTISSFRELAVEALGTLYETCIRFENAAFSEHGQIAEEWEKSAAARFLAQDILDLHKLASRTFAGEGFSVHEFSSLVEERLRELIDPGREINNCEIMVKNIAQRMEELPLDIQTGKDQRAAETVQHFSGIGEKLFRIFFLLKSEGLSLDTFVINGLPARTFMEEFNAALKELSAAYKNRDTVLAGDIAEYELAPRLLEFFTALKGSAEMNLPVS